MDDHERTEELMDNAAAAVRLLAEESGNTKEGRPLAVTSKEYNTKVGEAHHLQDSGAYLDQRATVLAGAPRFWWINRHGGGYQAICERAGITPRWRTAKEREAPTQDEPAPVRHPVYRAIENRHPPLPPLRAVSGAYYDTTARRRVEAQEAIAVMDEEGRPLPLPSGDPQAWLAALPAVLTVRVRTTERWAIV